MSPQKKWSAEAKLKALNESSVLSEADLGAYLRREGLHEPRLKEWREDALKALSAPPTSRVRDVRDDQIKDLEVELLRKDKALAEAAALLILQKKVHLIWDTNEREKR